MTESWPLVIGCAAIAIVVLGAIANARSTRPPRDSYRLKASVISPAEFHFYRQLHRAIPDDWNILVQVRLADVIDITPVDAKKRRRALSAIAAKSADFVICDGTFQPLLVIELNDSSHDRPDRRQRDLTIAQICESVGLPIYFTPVRSSYDLDELRNLVTGAATTTRPSRRGLWKRN